MSENATPPPSRSRHLWLPAAWFAGIALVVSRARLGDFDPAGRRYGADWPGDLRSALVGLSVEVVVLGLLLRPWSCRASYGRVVAALGVALPYTVLTLLGTMHAGPIGGSHALWRLGVSAGLVTAFFLSAATAGSYRRSGSLTSH